MRGMPHSNPMAIAKETVVIARETGSPAFEKAARWALIASAAVTAVVGLIHAARTIARDLTRKSECNRYGQPNHQSKQQSAGHDHDELPGRSGGDDRSWVEKVKPSDRETRSGRHWLNNREGHGHGCRR